MVQCAKFAGKEISECTRGNACICHEYIDDCDCSDCKTERITTLKLIKNDLLEALKVAHDVRSSSPAIGVSRMTDLEKFMIKQLDGESQAAWDFNADYKFAMKIGFEDVGTIRDAMYSNAPFPLIVSVWKMHWDKQVTQRRLRVLRALVKKKFVKAYWIGMGVGSKHEFGLNRMRHYELSTIGKLVIESLKNN